MTDAGPWQLPRCELASLKDTLDLLSDPEAMRELAESNEAGDFVDGDELRRRYPAK